MRLRVLAVFLTAALFAGLALAATAQIYAPAVVGEDEGEMILMEINVLPGNGTIYTTTDPLVGIDTQLSERTGVRWAFNKLGLQENAYNIYLTMNASDTSQIDGPSAGAAFGLLTLSAVNQSRIRSDMAMTGTISSNGGVGAVGGVASKADAAQKQGLAIILVPSENDAFEKILLAALSERLNITIIEVENMDQVLAVALSPTGSDPPIKGSREPRLIANLSAYAYQCTTCGIDKFQQIARQIVKESRNTFDSLPESNRSLFRLVLPLLRKETLDSEYELGQGYYYTAANTAFLNSMNARILQNATINRADLNFFIDDIETCISGTKRSLVTDENIDFHAGADLRLTWAELKLSEVKGKELLVRSGQDTLKVFRDALFAQSWCDVSGRLHLTAKDAGGIPKDENSLRTLAADRLTEAREKLGGAAHDSDADFHLQAAEYSYNRSRYGASIMDSNYVLGAVDAQNLSSDPDEVEREAESLSKKQGNTLWSALFFAHSNFNRQVGADPTTVIRLASIASRVDADSPVIRSALERPPEPTPTPGPEVVQVEDVNRLNQSLTVLIVLLSVLLITSAILNIVTLHQGKRKRIATPVARAPRKQKR